MNFSGEKRKKVYEKTKKVRSVKCYCADVCKNICCGRVSVC